MTEAELNAAITAFRLQTEDLIPAVLLKYYFNGGTPNYTPYATTTEALAVVGENWKPFMTVNVDGVDYWFLPDGSLVNKTASLSLLNGSVTMAKMADMAALSVIGNPTAEEGTPQAITIAALRALLEIPVVVDISNKVEKVEGSSLITAALLAKIHDKFAADELLYVDSKVAKETGYSLVADTEITRLALVKQNNYTLSLPAAASVADRLAGAVMPVGTTGWTVEAGASSLDLLITHGMGRRIVDCTIFSVDGTEESMLMGRSGYSGLKSPTEDTVLIMGLTTSAVALTVNLIFA